MRGIRHEYHFTRRVQQGGKREAHPPLLADVGSRAGFFVVLQGLVLDCSPLDWEPLEEFSEAASLAAAVNGSRRQPVWLALDEIGDPVRRHPGQLPLARARRSSQISPDLPKAAEGSRTAFNACNAVPFSGQRKVSSGRL
jgi:hypothetical protein